MKFKLVEKIRGLLPTTTKLQSLIPVRLQKEFQRRKEALLSDRRPQIKNLLEQAYLYILKSENGPEPLGAEQEFWGLEQKIKLETLHHTIADLSALWACPSPEEMEKVRVAFSSIRPSFRSAGAYQDCSNWSEERKEVADLAWGERADLGEATDLKDALSKTRARTHTWVYVGGVFRLVPYDKKVGEISFNGSEDEQVVGSLIYNKDDPRYHLVVTPNRVSWELDSPPQAPKITKEGHEKFTEDWSEVDLRPKPVKDSSGEKTEQAVVENLSQSDPDLTRLPVNCRMVGHIAIVTDLAGVEHKVDVEKGWIEDVYGYLHILAALGAPKAIVPEEDFSAEGKMEDEDTED